MRTVFLNDAPLANTEGVLSQNDGWRIIVGVCVVFEVSQFLD